MWSIFISELMPMYKSLSFLTTCGILLFTRATEFKNREHFFSKSLSFVSFPYSLFSWLRLTHWNIYSFQFISNDVSLPYCSVTSCYPWPEDIFIVNISFKYKDNFLQRHFDNQLTLKFWGRQTWKIERLIHR